MRINNGTFLVLGAVGFLWLIPWFMYYGRPVDKATSEELSWIHQDKEQVVDAQAVKWTKLLGYRQLWAFALGKMLTELIWWFFLFWLPKWLNESRGIDMAGLGLPLIGIYMFAIVGLAAAAHQGWSANLLTSVSDLFPNAVVGSVVGIGSTFGMIGSVIFSTVIGAVLEASGNYWALFAISSVAYLLAWGVMYLLLVPKMEPADGWW